MDDCPFELTTDECEQAWLKKELARSRPSSMTVDELLAALQCFKAANPEKGELPVGFMVTHEVYGFLPVSNVVLSTDRLNMSDDDETQFLKFD